jgi:hypothetical protein
MPLCCNPLEGALADSAATFPKSEQRRLGPHLDSTLTLQPIENAEGTVSGEISITNATARRLRRGELRTWIARAIIIATAAALGWYTWGHWGDFQIDCGREIYVPTAILQGKVLYREIWYPYGPLAPYVQAALFRILGIHLNVLYAFGLTLAVGSALTIFEIGRRLNLGIIASLVSPFVLLSQAFHPFIFNLIFPYSYAATLGCFLGLACLHLALLYAKSRCGSHLIGAALLASLAALTKLEFGLACLVLLGFAVSAIYFIDRSKVTLAKNALVFSTCLIPAAAIYAWFVGKTSLRALFFENWTAVPGSYFMRTYGKYMMAHQGLGFAPSEALDFAEVIVLAAVLWCLLAWINARLIQKFQLRSPRSITVWVAVETIPIAILINTSWAAKLVLVPLTRFLGPKPSFVQALASFRGFLGPVLLPKGIFFIGLIFLAVGIYKLWKRRTFGFEESAVAIYGLLAGLRQMMGLSGQTAVFFNTSLVLIFIIALQKVLNWGSWNLDAIRRGWLVNGLLAAEGFWLFLIFFPNPSPLPARLSTSIGSLYTQQDVAVLAPQIIDYMKTHTANGKDILVIPEPPSLYVFAGMQSPTRWHQLHPGIVSPEHEQDYINEIKSSDVRYILIANRPFPEYGVPQFLDGGYNLGLYRWIMANYTHIGEFGLTQKPVPLRAFMMWIYERKDLQAKAGN